MTDTYRISIDHKAGATLRGRVHIINPDAEQVPPGRDFPLRMIILLWHSMRERADVEVAAELQRLWDLDFGARIPLSGEQADQVRAVHRIRDHQEKEAARQVLKERYGVESLSLGGSDESPYLTGPRDGRAFYERACEIITGYHVGEVRNWPPPWPLGDDEYDDDFDEDEYADKLEQMTLEDYPYAQITLTVKDPRYLGHLGAGVHLAAAIHGEYGW